MPRPQYEDLDLEFPAIIDGEEHSKVRIRRVTGRDVERFNKGEATLPLVSTIRAGPSRQTSFSDCSMMMTSCRSTGLSSVFFPNG